MAAEGTAFEAKFREETKAGVLEAIHYFLPAAFFVNGAFWFLDRALVPAFATQSLIQRCIGSALIGVAYLLSHTPGGRRWPEWMAMLALGGAAWETTWLSTYGDATRAIYYVGDILVVCLAMVFPFSARWAALLTTLVVLQYGVVSWLTHRPYAEMAPPISLLIGCGTLTILVASAQTKRRRREFDLRLQVQDLNAREQTILRESVERLVVSSKMSALGEMAGGIAHEINNPLAIIQLLSEQVRGLVAEPVIDAAQVSLYTDRIVQTVDRISRIVKGLLNFARDASVDPIRPESLADVLEAAISLCREKFSANGVKLSCAEAPAGVRVLCRQTEAAQVLISLLNNAYDAIQPLELRWIRIEIGMDNGAHALISVTDSGSGIPPEIRNKMFQPFFTTKPPGIGTGMGLSIAKGLIENQNGRIEYDGACPNTRFVVSLPLARGAHAD